MSTPDEEPWPFGSGTEDDPYTAPPGWTLDTTQEEAAAMLDDARRRQREHP